MFFNCEEAGIEGNKSYLNGPSIIWYERRDGLMSLINGVRDIELWV